MPTSSLASFAAALLLVSPALYAAEISATAPAKTGLKGNPRVPQPRLAPASSEPEKAMKKFQVPAGFNVSTWAAEPMLGNPVAFTLDDQGRAFIAETFRYRTSVLDIRHYMFMLEDDLASRTTDDRIAYTKKNFPTDWPQLQVETEVVRLVQDKDGDGKADSSSVYADGMSTLLDGINSGVLVHEGSVFCTNMPNLWRFDGVTAEGKAERRESLSFGYGVRYSFTGHDMHGLILGPDGRLYFSFGDRGAHVVTKEGKTLAFPDEGAVFRCELDGSQMEVFSRGLRNPQELAFDDYGNLFTGDNDSDQGDRERWAYLVKGADFGWRIGWQHHPLSKEHNPWMAEHMWEPRRADTPYYLLSPVMNIPDGPSGVAFYPGTGLPAEYKNAFFVCGFKGSSARSAVSTWKVKPDGAGFVVDGEQKIFVGSVQSTDICFGPDSKMYFSEWGEGWEGTGRGRIFKMENAEALQQQASQVAEVKKLLGEGFKQRPNEELAKLLAHADQRVRFRAQWALADRAVAQKGTPAGDETGKLLMKIALDGSDGAQRKLSRIHAIWGIGTAGRRLLRAAHPDGNFEIPAPKAGEPLLTDDADPEIRAQALAVVGDLPGRLAPAFAKIIAAKLTDPSPRVRFFAANALAQHGDTSALPAVLTMLRENADKDQYLRLAGVEALSKASADQLAAAAKDDSRSVRLAALVAMRRLEKPEVAQFLTDADPLLVKEAARAINDAGITAAFGDLAKLISAPGTDEMLTIRAINANFRAGAPANAEALATFAEKEANSPALRVEALKALATWAKPFPRDRVAGVFRPLGERDGAPAIAALKNALPPLLATNAMPVTLAAIDAVTALQMKDAAPALLGLMAKPEISAKVRAQALEALADFDDPNLAQAIKLAVADKDPALRVKASAMLGKLDPEESATQLAKAFADAAMAEKKSVITALAGLKSAAADQALAGLLDALLAGQIPAEVQLELLEAAAPRTAPAVKTKLAIYSGNLSKTDPLAAFAPMLVGGNKDEGERIFKEHAVAQCLRCHKVGGSGGDAGPDLTGIGAKKDRRYLLEAIVLPNATISEGFQSVLVTLKDGSMQIGVVKAETERELTLQMPVPEAPAVKVAKAEIKTRENAPSGMIPGLGEMLTKRELRDLVEYVASLQ